MRYVQCAGAFNSLCTKGRTDFDRGLQKYPNGRPFPGLMHKIIVRTTGVLTYTDICIGGYRIPPQRGGAPRSRAFLWFAVDQMDGQITGESMEGIDALVFGQVYGVEGDKFDRVRCDRDNRYYATTPVD